MTNQEALTLLDEFTETASRAVQAAVWARAFLQEGGEPTWDAVKCVSDTAAYLSSQAVRVAQLRDHYEEVIP